MIGKRIKQYRLAHGWTLEKLAAMIDHAVTRQMLCKYEQGKSTPSRMVLIRLARAFGVKVVHLASEPPVMVKFFWHG